MKDSNSPIQIYSYSICCINYLIFFDGWSNFVVSFLSMHYFSLISAWYHYHNPHHNLDNYNYYWHSIFFFAWTICRVQLDFKIISFFLSFFIISIHITLISYLIIFLFIAHISFSDPNISFIVRHFYDHSLSKSVLIDLLTLLHSTRASWSIGNEHPWSELFLLYAFMSSSWLIDWYATPEYFSFADKLS